MKTNYIKTKEGAELFSKLAEADPKSALDTLKRILGKWNKEQTLEFTTGRREIVWALEKIAIWRELFCDAARLLLNLGEAENEPFGNNASGVFADLFSPGPGKVAPTEAPPEERLPVLKEALESSSKERRLLGLKACDKALQTPPFTRMVGSEHQGLRKEPNLWMPKTYGELFEAYRKSWHLLVEKLDALKEDERNEGVNVLLRNSRGLISIPDLADMVLDTLTALSTKPHVEKRNILSTIIGILHYDGKQLQDGIRNRLEHFKNELTGTGFSALMKRYVAMDLLEDEFDEEGNPVDKAQEEIEELAQQAISDTSLLEKEFAWLVTVEAQHGFQFGYELGKRDKDFKLLSLILTAQRTAPKNGTALFSGGYLRAVFQEDLTLWEEQLDEIAKDEKLNLWLPELTWRSGMTDRAALRVLNLAQEGTIGFEHFRLFGIGGVLKHLSDKVFQQVCSFLLAQDNYAATAIALDLHFFYYIHQGKTSLPEELTLKLLMHETLFEKPDKIKYGQMIEYHWTGIGKAYVQAYPEKALTLADIMLEHFNEDGTIFEGFFSETHSVLNEITKRYPDEIWDKIQKYLGPPIDSRAYSITEWLKGGKHLKKEEGALSLLFFDKVFRWVDENVKDRAWYLATFSPKDLFHVEAKKSIARKLLIKYGEREDVRRNLRANFSSETWSGPASLHYEEKRKTLLSFKKDENNENVKLWIDEYVTKLDAYIKGAKIEEEREF